MTALLARARKAAAAAAPTFIDATSSTTPTINYPASLAVGDVLIAWITTSSAAPSATDWVLLKFVAHRIGSLAGDAYCLVKVVDGSEGASVTFSSAGSNPLIGMVAYRNARVPTENNIRTGNMTQTLAGDLTASICPPLPGKIVHLFSDSSNGTNTLTLPSDGTSTRVNTTGSFWDLAIRDEDAVAGTAVTRTATSSGGTASWATLSLLLIGSSTVRYPWVASTRTATGNSSSPAIAAPAGLAVGDLLVITAEITGSNRTITADPSGFTAIDSKKTSSGGGQSLGCSSLYKIAVAGDIGATFTFTASGAQVWGASAVAIRDVDQSSPLVNAVVAGTAGSGSSITVPARTPSGSDAMALMIALGASNASATPRYFSADSIADVTLPGQSNFGTTLIGLHPVDDGVATPASSAVAPLNTSWFVNQVLLRPAVAA